MITGKFQVLGMLYYFAIAAAIVKRLRAEDQSSL